MKKLFFILYLFSNLPLFAQQKQLGMIRKEYSYKELSSKTGEPISRRMEITNYFKEDRSLMITNIETLITKILVDNNGMLMLTDVKRNMDDIKFFERKTKSEMKQLEGSKKRATKENLKIEYINEHKKLLGYNCSKAIVSYKDNKGEDNFSTIWYTEDIKLPQNKLNDGILNENIQSELKGIALEIDLIQGKRHGTMITKEVSTKPVADSVFNLSTIGYREIKPSAISK